MLVNLSFNVDNKREKKNGKTQKCGWLIIIILNNLIKLSKIKFFCYN